MYSMLTVVETQASVDAQSRRNRKGNSARSLGEALAGLQSGPTRMRLGFAQRFCFENIGSVVNVIVATSNSTRKAHRCYFHRLCNLLQGVVSHQRVYLF
jgi:hypothetical protein